MMKRIYVVVIITLLALCTSADSQSVSKAIIGPVAINQSTEGLSLTVGESIIGSNKNMDFYLGLGFQNGTDKRTITSIYQQSSDLQISIYPNPIVSKRLFIDIRNLNLGSQPSLDLSYQLYDPLGRRLLEGTLAVEQTNDVDMPNKLNTGIYALKILNGNHTVSSHLISYVSH